MSKYVALFLFNLVVNVGVNIHTLYLTRNITPDGWRWIWPFRWAVCAVLGLGLGLCGASALGIWRAL
jgi:hypothetical protein